MGQVECLRALKMLILGSAIAVAWVSTDNSVEAKVVKTAALSFLITAAWLHKSKEACIWKIPVLYLQICRRLRIFSTMLQTRNRQRIFPSIGALADIFAVQKWGGGWGG